MTEEQKKKPSISITLSTLLGILIGFAFSVWCIQDLWNYTLPDIFKVKEISYFEAMRLTVLIHFLFGSSRLWNSK
jgi:hypothetical protein